MTAQVTTAFWSMTINNPDETSLALVRNGYPDYCREIIHTLEEGEEGTPHIQAWVKLQRQQRLSFMRKLFPRGHFKPLTNAEYVHNTKVYAQKEDNTTVGPHVHVFHDPLDTIETLVKRVCIEIYKDFSYEEYSNAGLEMFRKKAQVNMVRKDYKLAKIFISAAYKAMWREYGPQIYECVMEEERAKKNATSELRVKLPVYVEDTHTHTHTDEKFSHQEGHNNEDAASASEDDAESEDEGSSGEDGEGDEDSEGEATEGYDESGSSCGGSSYVGEELGEQVYRLEGRGKRHSQQSDW